MFRDATTIDPNTQLTADICIAGGGTAGLHLAMTFLNTDTKVIVLEAGAEAYDPEIQERNDFKTTGLPIDQKSRTITYGGTSTVWGGLLCPLDEIDFEARPWVPNSGWPFTRKDLAPFYDEAATFLDIPKLAAFDPATIKNLPGQKELFSNSLVFEPNLFHFMKKAYLDFGQRFRRDLEAAPNITIITNANVSHLETDANGTSVTAVHVKTYKSNSFSVVAKNTVLALGGIENARLLLLSQSPAHPTGIGNTHDQVGRYYMDHPKARIGTIDFQESQDLTSHWGVTTAHGKSIVGIKLTAETQRTYQTLNTYVQAGYILDWKYRIKSKLLRRKIPVKKIELKTFMEQVPVATNRITLSDEVDSLGRRKASIAWSLSAQDKTTVRTIHTLIEKDLAASGLGRLESPLLTDSDYQAYDWHVKDASHHMGTTRMGHHPQTSVTNADAQVHGIDNLFIAGSSLFPAVGFANPTYTIFALTQKLSRYLKDKLGLVAANIEPTFKHQQTNNPNKKNVLIIGSGNRVKSTILPAFACLQDIFQISAVLSRTDKDLTPWNNGVPLATTTDLKKIDLAKIDLVFISISIKSVSVVLKQLSQYDTSKITLILETPGIYFAQVSKLKYTERFKKVVVAEDFLRLRYYLEVKKIIDSGAIGKVTQIKFSHFAVTHHGLALIKFLTDSNVIASIKKVAREGKERELQIKTANNISATIIEPCEYDRGTFLCVGETGSIANYPRENPNHFELSIKKTAANGYGGLTLNGQLLPPTASETTFENSLPDYKLQNVTIHEPLWLNQLKIQAVMDILKSLDDQTESFAYDPLSAVYDSLPSIFLDKLGFFKDFPIGRQTSLVQLLLRAIRSL